jgi:hypothetical protein
VASQREWNIVRRHAGAIITHSDQFTAAVLQRDLDCRRTRVYRVLDQLLRHGRWPLDYLAGSNLIGDGTGKN